MLYGRFESRATDKDVEREWRKMYPSIAGWFDEVKERNRRNYESTYGTITGRVSSKGPLPQGIIPEGELLMSLPPGEYQARIDGVDYGPSEFRIHLYTDEEIMAKTRKKARKARRSKTTAKTTGAKGKRKNGPRRVKPVESVIDWGVDLKHVNPGSSKEPKNYPQAKRVISTLEYLLNKAQEKISDQQVSHAKDLSKVHLDSTAMREAFEKGKLSEQRHREAQMVDRLMMILEQFARQNHSVTVTNA